MKLTASALKLRSVAAQHLSSIAIVCLCAALGILGTSLRSNVNSNTPSATDNWYLPTLDERLLVSDVDTMLAAPLFGGEPVLRVVEAPEEPTEKEPVGDTWRLLGIMTEGNSKHVVIFNEATGKTEIAQLGQTLPGGEELIAIGSNEIEVDDTEVRKVLSLFADSSSEGISR